MPVGRSLLRRASDPFSRELVLTFCVALPALVSCPSTTRSNFLCSARSSRADLASTFAVEYSLSGSQLVKQAYLVACELPEGEPRVECMESGWVVRSRSFCTLFHWRKEIALQFTSHPLISSKGGICPPSSHSCHDFRASHTFKVAGQVDESRAFVN